MRSSMKQQMHFDRHDPSFINDEIDARGEADRLAVEIASEYGLSIYDVKRMKKRLSKTKRT